ncbi:hypothetical protein BJ138DRAFT_1077376 [Hygrophoropsis aurantiaca]|uniref:Uncharacterized protein n=1 Tax=Hygrophoropsis aurantiaca TaxID=72124 RepID=A0ACB8APR3_9AGAM|nr:hypothetical protein BJ138DRAFT_1077376 [Hygrophoropsis aurantiaca]
MSSLLRSLSSTLPLSTCTYGRRSLATTVNTHFKITLRRSAIALGEKKKETLVSLGLHRRMQIVYHLHSPETAGKILKVKELVEVENVPAQAVRSQTEQRAERKASRGYVVSGNRLSGMSWEAKR